MKAEIVSIGDEMTNGQRLDTNSQWLSQQLADLGITTVRHTTVADDLEMNVDVFRTAASRVDFVISSGGLGPTLDDLTREALAMAFNRALELHEPSLRHIESLFARRQRAMPERNRVQAMIPTGSEIIPNPHGTAPGIDLSVETPWGRQCRVFALPGVPAEMKEMWHQTVMPRIIELLGPKRKQLYFHTVKVFGLGESDVEAKLPDLIRRDRVPRVGITVSQATIALRIAGTASNECEFQEAIEPTLKEIHNALGLLIFGSGEDEIQDATVRLLKGQELSLAVIEIGQSASIAKFLFEADRRGLPCIRGVTTFATVQYAVTAFADSVDATGSLPAPPPPEAELEKSLSWLADAIRIRFDADIGLAFGPYPPPDQVATSSTASAIGFAVSSDAVGSSAEIRMMGGHPEVICDRIAKTAMDIVRLKLQNVNQPL